MSKILRKSSVLPIGAEELWEEIKYFKSLQYISYPYAVFESVNGRKDFLWKKGRTFQLNCKIFNFIPFGVHTIKITDFDSESLEISSKESNSHVPVWNHKIYIKPVDSTHTKYMDKVEIDAGWKTTFIYMWAKLFYSHRHRKWKKIIRKNIRL